MNGIRGNGAVAAVLELIGLPACACDAAGMLLAANAELTTLLGYDPEEADLSALITGATPDQLQASLSSSQRWDATLQTASEHIPVSVATKPLPAAEGPAGLTLVFTDVRRYQRDRHHQCADRENPERRRASIVAPPSCRHCLPGTARLRCAPAGPALRCSTRRPWRSTAARVPGPASRCPTGRPHGGPPGSISATAEPSTVTAGRWAPSGLTRTHTRARTVSPSTATRPAPS